jgi:hypothetical protein
MKKDEQPPIAEEKRLADEEAYRKAQYEQRPNKKEVSWIKGIATPNKKV